MTEPARRWRVARAARVVAAGGVVAYPTEGVYGLGCEPLDADAVARVRALKGRPDSKGFVLIASDPADLVGWLAPAGPAQWDRVLASWPGPVTWVVRARAWVPRWLTGGSGRLAVRVTSHPLARALAEAVGGPIVSTSANRVGAPPARSALSVRLRFGARVDAILAGALGGALGSSEIRDADTGAVLRAAVGTGPGGPA